jgi:hypothetical protein
MTTLEAGEAEMRRPANKRTNKETKKQKRNNLPTYLPTYLLHNHAQEFLFSGTQ